MPRAPHPATGDGHPATDEDDGRRATDDVRRQTEAPLPGPGSTSRAGQRRVRAGRGPLRRYSVLIAASMFSLAARRAGQSAASMPTTAASARKSAIRSHGSTSEYVESD